VNQETESAEAVLCEAIRRRRAVSFSYKNQPRRLVEPHLVGTRKGTETRQLCAWWLSGHAESDQEPGWHGPYVLTSISDIVIEEYELDTPRPGYVAEADSRMTDVGCYIPLSEPPYQPTN